MTEFVARFSALEDKFWFEPASSQKMLEMAEDLKRFIQDLGVVRSSQKELYLHCKFDPLTRRVWVIGEDYITIGVLRDFFSYLVEVEEYTPRIFEFLESEV